jgi:hypothetical protein
MPTPVYEELTFPYEILLRFGNTETNRGKLTGGQLQKITQIYKDGQKFGPEVPGVPEQLALVAGEEGELLSVVLGDVNAATIVLNGQLQASLADLNTIAAQQLEQLTQVRGELSTAQGDLATAQQTIADLQAQLAQGRTVEEMPAGVVAENYPTA